MRRGQSESIIGDGEIIQPDIIEHVGQGPGFESTHSSGPAICRFNQESNAKRRQPPTMLAIIGIIKKSRWLMFSWNSLPPSYTSPTIYELLWPPQVARYQPT